MIRPSIKEKSREAKEYYTIGDLCVKLDCTRQKIMTLINKGELRALKLSNDYRVAIKDFEHFLMSNFTKELH